VEGWNTDCEFEENDIKTLAFGLKSHILITQTISIHKWWNIRH
jgi:hypothetical protein